MKLTNMLVALAGLLMVATLAEARVLTSTHNVDVVSTFTSVYVPIGGEAQCKIAAAVVLSSCLPAVTAYTDQDRAADLAAGKARHGPRHLVIFTMYTKYFMVIHTK